MDTDSYPVRAADVSLRIGHLSDLHYGKSPATVPRSRDALNRLVEAGVDVIVVSGDLAQLPDDHDQLGAVRALLDATGVPYVTVSGNHDVATPGEDSVYASYFGRLPRVERVAGATFLLFDSFGDLPVSDRPPEDYDDTWGCWGDGEISSDQLTTMETLLEPDDTLRLAVVHHHLTDEPHPQVNPLRNADEFLEWCREHAVYGVFVGHLHRPSPPADLDGVYRFRTGRTTKPPFPTGVLDVGAGAYEVTSER